MIADCGRRGARRLKKRTPPAPPQATELPLPGPTDSKAASNATWARVIHTQPRIASNSIKVPKARTPTGQQPESMGPRTLEIGRGGAVVERNRSHGGTMHMSMWLPFQCATWHIP